MKEYNSNVATMIALNRLRLPIKNKRRVICLANDSVLSGSSPRSRVSQESEIRDNFLQRETSSLAIHFSKNVYSIRHFFGAETRLKKISPWQRICSMKPRMYSRKEVNTHTRAEKIYYFASGVAVPRLVNIPFRAISTSGTISRLPT